MEHWKEIAAIIGSLVATTAGGIAKIYASNAGMYKELWESEKEDRMRLEDKLDEFYAEGRTLALQRDAENTALRREVEDLRGVIASGGNSPHALPSSGQD